MALEIHELTQGSDAWLHFRQHHFGASEAAAMLGLSSKVKRTELLHMKTVGLPKEFSDWFQANVLDYGHDVEALARPVVENIIGDDLYPVTCSVDVLPKWCAHQLSASLDGLTMSERIAFEHKQWNTELAASVAAGELPDEHAPQCQQILLVTGAEKLLFVVSDGTAENIVYMWVYPDAAWFERITAGWEQFAKDMAEYVPRQLADKPQADAIMALPALVVQIRGEVANSNLPTFKAAAERFIANIKTDLQSDEDFANAEATVKFCAAAESSLKAAKSAAIAQTASIDELMRTVDLIEDQLRAKRLMLEKLVTKRKIEIKETILAEAKLAYSEHVAALEGELRPIRLFATAPDFAGAMKNKRTLASLHDAVDTLLAGAKIVTNTTAADYRAKQAWCAEHAGAYKFLLMDLQQIITKPMDDFQLVVTTRIAEHQRAEAQKAEELRARIAAEERAKAEAAAAKAARAAQEEADRRARAVAAAAAKAAPQPPASAQPELARQSDFYNEPTPRDTPAGRRNPTGILNPAAAWPPAPRPATEIIDALTDSGPTDDDILAFGAEHDMELGELIPRLERFIADARAGALACAA